MNRIDELSTQQQRELYELCWEFEDAWLSGDRRPMEEWLREVHNIPAEIVLGELTETQRELEERLPQGGIEQLQTEPVKTAERENSRQEPPQFRDDRYQFIEEIDRGGAAVVWRVRDRHLERETAIKYLLDSQDNLEMRSRLEREARLCARLVHPGIVPIHELSSFADQRPFVSMKLVEGKTLQQLLSEREKSVRPLFCKAPFGPLRGKRGLKLFSRPFLSGAQPPSVQAAIEIFSKVCQAMAFAHDREIIHRDLKPSNIMVGSFGEVQIMDWGLAKDLSKTSEETKSHGLPMLPAGASASDETMSDARHSDATVVGSVFGTIAYMSPEQARGDIDRIGKPADVFALGAVLCRILTGSPPYQSTDQQSLLAKAQEGDLTAAHQLLARCRRRKYAALAIHCLSPYPAARPADAAAMVRRLEAIQRQEHGQRQALGYFLAAAVAVIAIGFMLWRPRADAPQPIAPSQPTLLGESLELPRLKSLLRSNQNHLLLDSYEAALRRFPEDQELRYFVSVALINARRYKEADQLLSELIKLDPENCEYHYIYGQSLCQQGRFKEAEFETLESIELWDHERFAHLPVESALAKITRCLEYSRLVASEPPPSFDSLSTEELIEVADTCDLTNKVELAAHYYSLAFEKDQDALNRSKNRQYEFRWFVVKNLESDDLSDEARDTVCKAAIQWLRDQLEFATQPEANILSIQRSSQLLNYLKTCPEVATFGSFASDQRLSEAVRAGISEVVRAIQVAKSPE